MRCLIGVDRFKRKTRRKYTAVRVTLNGMSSLCSGHRQGKLIPLWNARVLENIIPFILA